MNHFLAKAGVVKKYISQLACSAKYLILVQKFLRKPKGLHSNLNEIACFAPLSWNKSFETL